MLSAWYLLIHSSLQLAKISFSSLLHKLKQKSWFVQSPTVVSQPQAWDLSPLHKYKSYPQANFCFWRNTPSYRAISTPISSKGAPTKTVYQRSGTPMRYIAHMWRMEASLMKELLKLFQATSSWNRVQQNTSLPATQPAMNSPAPSVTTWLHDLCSCQPFRPTQPHILHSLPETAFLLLTACLWFCYFSDPSVSWFNYKT